jgi:hypothetical protein
MSTPAVGRPAAARDIVDEVIRNMRQARAWNPCTTLPPAIYHFYLRPEDFERLRGICPRMRDMAGLPARQAPGKNADMNSDSDYVAPNFGGRHPRQQGENDAKYRR